MIKLLANLWAIEPIFQNTVLETIEFSFFSRFPLLPEVFLDNLLSTYPPFIPLFIPTIPHEIEPKLPTEKSSYELTNTYILVLNSLVWLFLKSDRINLI